MQEYDRTGTVLEHCNAAYHYGTESGPWGVLYGREAKWDDASLVMLTVRRGSRYG